MFPPPQPNPHLGKTFRLRFFAFNPCIIETQGLCTLSPKFPHAFFRIRNPKNSSRTDRDATIIDFVGTIIV